MGGQTCHSPDFGNLKPQDHTFDYVCDNCKDCGMKTYFV